MWIKKVIRDETVPLFTMKRYPYYDETVPLPIVYIDIVNPVVSRLKNVENSIFEEITLGSLCSQIPNLDPKIQNLVSVACVEELLPEATCKRASKLFNKASSDIPLLPLPSVSKKGA